MIESDVDRLFHFTKTAKNLKSILETNEFWVMYRKEDLRFLNYKKKFKNIKHIVAYPMVCFCDIPFDRQKLHTFNYGNFGIGMKRNWAIKNKISPVHYIGKNSRTSDIWVDIINQIDRIITEEPETLKFNIDFFQNLIDIGTFIKPYRSGKKIFYNEREWRFYPKVIFSDVISSDVKKQRFLINDCIANYLEENGSFKSDFKLSFDYNEIDCLIVPDEKNKERFIRVLEQLNITGLNIKIIPQL